jgi:hypothetical protein
MDSYILIQNLGSLPTTKIFLDERTQQEIEFQLETEKIQYFCEAYLPKWKENKPYYLISQRLWGIHQQILL